MDMQDKVREAVREALRQKMLSGGSPTRNKTPVTESVEIVEEGVGSAIVKTLGTFVGAALGSAGGAITGAITGQVTTVGAILALGAATPAALGVLPVTLAGVGWLAGLYYGGRLGLNVSRNVTRKDYEKVSQELVDVTHQRDALIKQLSGDQEKDAKLIKRIGSLSDKQSATAKKLKKELDWYMRSGLIQLGEYNFAMKMVKTAEDGKLTYLEAK